MEVFKKSLGIRKRAITSAKANPYYWEVITLKMRFPLLLTWKEGKPNFPERQLGKNSRI